MRSSRPLAALAAATIVALSVALRATRLTSGLPEFVDEAAPFRWAMEMLSRPGVRIDWNPHHFIYPSLTIYLHLVLQLAQALVGSGTGLARALADHALAYRLDPTPMVVLARALGIAADAASVWLTYRIGERLGRGAGLFAALLVALSPILIATASTIHPDPVMLSFSLAALDRMQRYRADDRSPGRWWIAVFTGLAIGSKYPAVVLLAPIGWTLLRAHGVRGGLVRLPLVFGVVAITFLATTPYAVLDRVTFLRDVAFDRVLASEGLLGATAGPSGWHTLGALVRDLGPVTAALALVGLAFALARPHAPAGPFMLALTALAFLVPVLASPLRFERYLVAVTPLACLLAGVVVTWAARRIPSRARAPALAVIVLAAALPVAVRAWATVSAARSTTEAQARAWISTHLTSDVLIVMEPYGPWIATRREAPVDGDSPLVAAASPAWRARYLARPWWSAVRLPALVAGTLVVRVQPRSGAAVDVTVFEHASDFNRVVYDTRLLAGVDYVLTTDAVRGRFEADPSRYAVPCAFYRHLDSTASVVASFQSSAAVSGPRILVYRLGRESAAAALAPLDRWWWAQRIPEPFRHQADALLAPGFVSTGAVEAAPGLPSPWVIGLKDLYGTQLRTFAEDLAWNLLALDRPAPAARLMDAEQAIEPESQLACLLRMEACRALGDWRGARAAFERTALAIPAAVLDSSLVAGYAEALEHTGAAKRASALRDSLAVLSTR